MYGVKTGQEVLSRAKDLLDSYDALAALSSLSATEPSGTVRIAAALSGGRLTVAVGAAAEGQRVADESGRLAEDGLAGLRRTSLVADTVEHCTALAAQAVRALPDLPGSEALGILRELPGAYLDWACSQMG